MKKQLFVSMLVLLLLTFGWTAMAAAQGGNEPAAQTTPAASPNGPNVRIVKPAENAIVPVGNVPVQIAAENFTFDASHRWQIYLDEKLVGTMATDTLTCTVPITTSGPHEIRATLADAGAGALASASVDVTAAPATPGAAFNRTSMGPVMAAMAVVILLIIGVALRISRRATAV